ncbi:MAG: hypothetical protein EOP19_07720 [Hyphomicrobiales bacterium]|nr:MAG: hypothetical protein EOP19_07720 [Hyphomicrobiales bacterium]
MSSLLPTPRKFIAIFAVVSVFGAAALGTVAQAQNDIVGEWNHFARCFGLMVNNTPRQVRECDPVVNRSVFSNDSLSTPVSGSPAPAPTLPPSSGSSTTTYIPPV